MMLFGWKYYLNVEYILGVCRIGMRLALFDSDTQAKMKGVIMNFCLHEGPLKLTLHWKKKCYFFRFKALLIFFKSSHRLFGQGFWLKIIDIANAFNDKLSGSVLRSVAEQNRIRWSDGLAHFLCRFEP
jgi:hypothetical protein